jgi:SAM-dependent methyltransferase
VLDDEALTRSSVVANCTMNRERRLAGSNGYGRELGFDVADLITDRLSRGAGTFRWLDLCCGTGTALLECARLVADPRLRITGVDLVDFFAGPPHPGVEFVTGPVASFVPRHHYDLVTCVHGLHYVGDKLDVLTRAASWLTEDGLLVANLDLAAIVTEQGRPWGRRLAGALRSAGFDHDSRRRRISRVGHLDVRLPFRYLGADDRAGPNYTGQPAVNSHYAEAHHPRPRHP